MSGPATYPKILFPTVFGQPGAQHKILHHDSLSKKEQHVRIYDVTQIRRMLARANTRSFQDFLDFGPT